MPTTIADRVAALRQIVEQGGGDGFIVPHEDEYQNENLPLWAERLAWLTGFTGSAGVAVVLMDKAVVMSDARYTLQLPQQCDAAIFTTENSSKVGVATWLKQNAPTGAKIFYDAFLHSKAQIDALTRALDGTGIVLAALTPNPIDTVWDKEGRPALPAAPVTLFPEILSGTSSRDKRAALATQLRADGHHATLLTAQDSVAWLLNIRGADVPQTPVALSYLLLRADGHAVWFIPPAKIPEDVRDALGDDVTIVPPDALAQHIADLRGQAVRIDSAQCSAAIFDMLIAQDISVVAGPDLCLLPRAIKTSAEQAAMRQAHIRDGVAMVKFLHWLDGQVAAKAKMDEVSIGAKLTTFRAQAAEFRDISFDPIVGFNGNGAIIHYRAENDPTNAAQVTGNGVLLIDSGAQYSDGTTDITRTLAINTVPDDIRASSTAVLRGHIALASAVFPQGTTGIQLDTLARAPLWRVGLDYPHGTGHGVGCYLSVHEAAGQGIHARGAAPILPGMILSNEPGYYREGAFGIRIENLILCQDVGRNYDDGRARCSFETITLCPYDRNMIVAADLTPAEIAWINAYHAQVRTKLTPFLDADQAAWLHAQTEAL
ncbi:MAG: aminopeptidase P family protein [Pseudomonadota bacterium]